ncbi:hypothetical protein [Dactylosporangium cerinum]
MSRKFLAYLVELDQQGRLVVNGVPLPPGPHHAADGRDDGESRLSYALGQVSAFSARRDPRDPPMDVTVKDQRAGGLGVHHFALPPQATLTLADLRVTAPPPPPPPDERWFPMAPEPEAEPPTREPALEPEAEPPTREPAPEPGPARRRPRCGPG